MIKDMNGVEISNGCRVRIHQEDKISRATVVELFPDNPTVKMVNNIPGFWVDIKRDSDKLIEGMMSYILEVIDEEE